LPQRLALDELHHDVDAPLELSHVVDGGDVGVAHRRGGPRLAQHALPSRLVGGHLAPQYLQSHLALEALVDRAVHHAHAAEAELLDDAKAPQPLHGLSS
jgi:hypothetical protein